MIAHSPFARCARLSEPCGEKWMACGAFPPTHVAVLTLAQGSQWATIRRQSSTPGKFNLLDHAFPHDTTASHHRRPYEVVSPERPVRGSGPHNHCVTWPHLFKSGPTILPLHVPLKGPRQRRAWRYEQAHIIDAPAPAIYDLGPEASGEV